MRLVLLIIVAWLLVDVLIVAGLNAARRIYWAVWRARAARGPRGSRYVRARQL